MIKIIITISLCIFIYSCGSDGDNDNSESNNKDLFSIWESESGNIIDLQEASFSETVDWYYFFVDGAECNCDLTVIGDEESGAYVINSCFYEEDSSVSGDPGCDALNETGDYSNSNGTLTIQSNGPYEPVFYY